MPADWDKCSRKLGGKLNVPAGSKYHFSILYYTQEGGGIIPMLYPLILHLQLVAQDNGAEINRCLPVPAI